MEEQPRPGTISIGTQIKWVWEMEEDVAWVTFMIGIESGDLEISHILLLSLMKRAKSTMLRTSISQIISQILCVITNY